MKTVAVGLSGGVDSTLTAMLLKEQGYQVVGLSMSIYNKDIPSLKPAGKSCYGPEEKQDIKDIQQWAENQGIKSYIIDLSEEYKQVVLADFKRCYLSGQTPNPCVLCNTEMKFGLLADKAKEQGIAFDYFATGHYARIDQIKDRYFVRKGVDDKKDQSYFLYRLTQHQLARTLFPLGHMTKDKVRELARERGLIQAQKADSQDFYGGDYTDLLEQPQRPGLIIHTSGKILGRHQGFFNYTIGQRKGLGVSYPVPLFVVDLDPEKNQVIVGEAYETFSTHCFATHCSWMALDKAPTEPVRVLAKYRSAGRAVPAMMKAYEKGVQIIFDEPQKSLTPGQSIVFYGADIPHETDLFLTSDMVLGGGIIHR